MGFSSCCCPSGGRDPSAAGGRRTEDGGRIRDGQRPYGNAPAIRPRPSVVCRPLRGGAGIKRLDLAAIFLVHELALELHGRGQLVVLRGELLLDKIEFLDRFHPSE